MSDGEERFPYQVHYSNSASLGILSVYMSSTLELDCWVFGESLKRIFTVKIANGECGHFERMDKKRAFRDDSTFGA